MVARIKSVFLSPWFLALVFTSITLLFLPEMFGKYRIRILESGNLPQQELYSIRYADLDHDGNSERVAVMFNSDSMAAFQVFVPDGGVYDQWNFNGTLVDKWSSCFIGNADHDSFEEIYLITWDGDSLFLNGKEPFDTTSPINFEKKRLCVLSHNYGEPDPKIEEITMGDLTGDGLLDLVISISSGRAKIPRVVVAYSIPEDKLITSESYGTYFSTIKLADLDRNGILEIYGDSEAGGSIADSLGYRFSDYSAWLMSLDTNLRLRFEPVEFPGFQSTVRIEPTTIKGEPLLAVLYNHGGPHENRPQLMLVDASGKIKVRYTFPLSDKNERQLIISEDDGEKILSINDYHGNLIRFNENLEFLDSLNIGYSNFSVYSTLDLDADGQRDYFLYFSEGDDMITSSDFDHPLQVNLPSGKPRGKISLIESTNAPPRICHSGDGKYSIFVYERNPWYYARFPIYAGIVLLFWLFIVLIRKIQLIQIQRRELVRRQIMELQLKAIKNQMDPHFTFNVFNTMAAMIQEESQKVYHPFLKFTALIRNTLESTDKIVRPLSEEIMFVQNYLDLEILRNPDLFDYSLEIDESIDLSMKVPKMLLQIYVENAVKHGLRHKEKKGLLTVSIRKGGGNLELEVTDNGIGRIRAKEISTGSTGFGLRIMEDYFKLFNEYNTSKIQHTIIDLVDDQNHPAGTQVRITIPLNFSYKFSEHGK